MEPNSHEMKPVTASAMSAELRRRLAPVYGSGEANAMIRLIFHALKGWNATGLAVNFDTILSPALIRETDTILSRLERHEPIQYILGEADFHGLRLKVTPDVLIPRPETSQLVDLILDDEKERRDLRVLDIGTGSGAIAIALARDLPFARVTATDISAAALDVARDNADRLRTRLDLIHADIFSWQPDPESFDIVVSNPPYIPEEEKKEIEKNVKDYEPAGALFVPDDDPICFYERIADVATHALCPEGKLYFEINPRFADSVSSMLSAKGFEKVSVIRDCFNRLRFVSAVKPSGND